MDKELVERTRTADKPKIVIVHESVLRSIVKDAITFLTITGTLFVSVKYLGNHWYINLPVVVMALLAFGGRNSKQIRTFYSKKDAIKNIQSDDF